MKPAVWLSLDKAIPIHEDFIWNNLSFTTTLAKNYTHWTGMVRNSLKKLDEADGKLLIDALTYQYSEINYLKLLKMMRKN